MRHYENCPNCNTQIGVTYAFVNHEFEYGAGANAVTLGAVILEGICSKCDFAWRGSQAEEAITEATLHYLQKEVSDLRSKLKAFQEASKA